MIVQPEAEADLAEARRWYEEKGSGLGVKFMRSVESVFAQIERMPTSHAENPDGIRRALTKRFPYAVYYLIEAEDVIVLGVLHTRRDPGQLKSRL